MLMLIGNPNERMWNNRAAGIIGDDVKAFFVLTLHNTRPLILRRRLNVNRIKDINISE